MVSLFANSNGFFSEKEVERLKKIEKKNIKEHQRILKQKFKNEERKRKVVNKLRKTHTREMREIQKEELKKIKAQKARKQEIKEIKKIIKKEITIKKPTIFELETHLLKLSDDYDHGIHKSKRVYKELLYLGLTDNGLREFHGESEKKRNKRIAKINEAHKILMNILEHNKEIEQRIELIDNEIKKEQYK